MISWFALHNTPTSYLRDGRLNKLGHGTFGVFAARKSGMHPDTGYAGDCWALNLNAPVGQWIEEQVLGICQRTGLAGFLWDSFSNLGWWQIDCSKGDLRPQFDKMARLYAAFTKAGLFLTPEGQVTFSSHSMLGMHGGSNVYDGAALPYSYDSCTALWWGDVCYGNSFDCQILRGQQPIDMLFQCYAHRRSPLLNLHLVPPAERQAAAQAAIKETIALYQQVRPLQQRRTVLKDGAGVRWGNDQDQPLLFSFRAQPWPEPVTDCQTGALVEEGQLQPNRVYRLAPVAAAGCIDSTKPPAPGG